MSKKWLSAMACSAAMAFSAGAMAQTIPGFYLGAEVGQTDVGSEDDTGFKVFGGYQFHRNIAAELGYGLLFDKGAVELTTLELVAVGIFPLTNQFSLLGKLGLARLEVDTPGGSDSDNEVTYGIGVQYDFAPNIGLRLQWQRYDTNPDEIDFINLGVVVRF